MDGQSVAGYVRIFSNKTATVLKSTIVVPHSVHDVLLISTYSF